MEYLMYSLPSHPIYHLRDAQLDTHLMYQLASILYAYRPHTAIPTKEELGDRVTTTHITLNDTISQITP